MKTYIKLSVIAATILALGTTPARADDEAIAAIGGFVAGVITGSILDDQDHRHRSDVYVEVRDRHDYGRHRDYDRYRNYDRHRKDYGHKSGHWEVRRVRIWMPGRWEFVYDHCGDRIRVWRSGHYVYRKDRVWVSHRDRGRHPRHWD